MHKFVIQGPSNEQRLACVNVADLVASKRHDTAVCCETAFDVLYASASALVASITVAVCSVNN